MGFYSIQPRARSLIKKGKAAAGPDPYAPGSPAFDERHRRTTRQHPSGLVQVDLGEPPPRYT